MVKKKKEKKDIKCLVLSNQQSKTKRCSVNHHQRQGKLENVHIWQA